MTFAMEKPVMRIINTAARTAALAGALALAACATDQAGPSAGSRVAGRAEGRAEVTRFFLAPDIARGAVFVEPLDPRDGGGPRFAAIRGAVEDNLRAAGFRPVPDRAAADLVAVVGITRALRPSVAPDQSGSRVHGGFGLGGSSGRYGGVGGGVGLGISFGGKRRPRDTAIDTMTLALRRKSDSTNIWEGRAVSDVDASRSGDPADRAFFLARALLADFPGRSAVTVRYPPRAR